jgi:dTMP kinase
MGRGYLIALEGVDGAGKTTQAMSLAAILARFGRRVLFTREPTFGPEGLRLREYLTGGQRHLSPAEELALFQSDRREHVTRTIQPALEQSWVVITDRYYYSSAAYQGALGLDPREILADSEGFAPRPDLVVILTLPLDQAVARCLEGRDEALQVSEVPAYLEKVAALYDTFQGPHLRRLDGSPPAYEVQKKLLDLALEFLVAPKAGLAEK